MVSKIPNKRIYGVLRLILFACICIFGSYLVTRKLNSVQKDGDKKPNEDKLHPGLSHDNRYRHLNPLQNQRELENLGKLVQNRLRILQNPKSCNTTRIAKCLVHYCGLGCQINTAGLCLMLGYVLNRTIVIEPPLPSIIQPLSTTCISGDGKNSKPLGENNTSYRILAVYPPNIKYKSNMYPPAVPDDLVDKITGLHRDPFLWWVGQISRYVFRPTEATAEFLEMKEATLGFSSPIAGIHVRRTDKVLRQKNAKYHSVDEYMVFVEKWYEELEKRFPRVPRRVFLAADNSSVKQELNMKYPEYTILTDDNYTRSAEHLYERRMAHGKLGILHDTYMLSKCDFVVCTFSSNICTLTHQLMQSQRGNDTHSLISLDSKWHFVGGTIFKKTREP